MCEECHHRYVNEGPDDEVSFMKYGGIADTDRDTSRSQGTCDSGWSVFENDAAGGSQVEPLGCAKEDVGVRLGRGQLSWVHDGVEEVGDTGTLHDDRRVAARRRESHRDVQAPERLQQVKSTGK